MPERLKNYLTKHEKSEEALHRIYNDLNPFKVLGDYLS